MKCCCINKDICIICQDYKYYNIYCTRCVSGKICYKCSSSMLENVLIKSCPVCRLETTGDKKWYSIKYNTKIIVPVNTEQILFEHEKETKLEKCCLEADELCIKIIIFYKHLIFIVGCLMMNYVIGLALLFMFTDAEKEEKKSDLYLILVPNVFGFLFFVLIGLCLKVCCKCNFNQY